MAVDKSERLCELLRITVTKCVTTICLCCALARIAKLIKCEFGHTFSTVHVWRMIRDLGLSSPRPTGRALQCDEEAILAWKTKR